MNYIKVQFETLGTAYQEVDERGHVVRYLSPKGREMFKTAPLGEGSCVFDAHPQLTKEFCEALDIPYYDAEIEDEDGSDQ
jgi:hypothetical protein